MTSNQKPQAKVRQVIEEQDTFSQIRRYRLMQISAVSSLGLLASILVAKGITFTIFAAGLVCLLVAFLCAFNRKLLTSAYVLLGSMSLMLCALALTGAGLFDLAILGYPVLFIFAAILGNVGLFMSVLIFVIAQSIFLTWLTLNSIITPHVPILSWPHLVFILVIFIVTGFTVYIMVRDIKGLMHSLQRENIKVQQSQTKIQHLAHHDALTNLPNRFYGEELYWQTLAICEEKQQNLALFFIDLDNFKPINDALGHAAGDELLQRLTHRLTVSLPTGHHLIRFGGDEFLVLAPFTGESDQLRKLATKLIQQCASVFDILQTQVVVSASLGIACAPRDGRDFKQLCRRADIAMYKAKEDGRNTFHFYEDSLDQANDEKFKLLQLLRPALNQRQFELYYQPMISLKSCAIDTVEALIRWPQEDGSMVGPDQFIPLAESSGLINELGSWVLQQSCVHCAQMRQQGFSKLRVAVNLSVVQFKDGKLYNIVKAALDAAALPPEALELELTESLLVDDTDLIQKQLDALSQIGITIAIDDFGTGYSNLGYLRNFNATTLKIDRSFIGPLCTSEQDEPLVQAIISMAASLGLKTVAEGIEDADTLEKLIQLGCDIGQGYYWSKPVPIDELPNLLRKQQQHNCHLPIPNTFNAS